MRKTTEAIRINNGLWINILVILVSAVSCITPYQPDAISNVSSLVVEGQITDQPGPYTVKLTRTADYSYKSLNLLETGATVTISDNLGNKEILKEQPPGGTYQTSVAGIRGIADRSYKLTIQTKTGTSYESSQEVLSAAPAIQKLYYESNYTPPSGIAAGKQSWTVFLDSKDPDTLGNYYKWSWTHYAFTDVCRKTFVLGQNMYTGILCCSECWDISRCYTCININSDVNINGKAISRQLITQVPFTSKSRYYIEIEQQALSKGAYQFWKSVQQLTSTTGGLFDAAPSTVKGNLRCINKDNELVYGYFGATGLSASYLLVDRSDGQGEPTVDLPVVVPYPTNPSCVVCENSLYRTPNKPRWWTN